MALTAGQSAPYAPPAGVVEILRRYRERGLPKPITTDVLERAGISPTLSQRTHQALRLLGLIDSEGNPSPEFDAASRAPEQDYKERLGDIIIEVYSEVIQFADPDTDSYDRVRDAFRSFNPQGQQERMVTLFLGLLDYIGVNTTAATASRRKTATSAPPKRPSGESSAPRQRGGPTSTARGRKALGSKDRSDVRDAALVAWFDTRPDPGTPWASEDRDSFITTLRAIINGIYSEPMGNPDGDHDEQIEDSAPSKRAIHLTS
jgi:hypothetical protein